MSRRRLPIYSDFFGRPCFVPSFTQGPSRSVRFTAFHLTDPADIAGHGEDDADGDETIDQRVRDLVALLADNQHTSIEQESLTPNQRQVIEEVLFKSRTITDVASELNKSVEALRQRIAGTMRPGGRRHGGISRKAPVLYALWLFRHRERHDIAEVLNAISRAINSLNPQPPESSA